MVRYWISFWILCIFFFKQKTAYEMRISDWSSDVCSSDLGAIQRIGLDVQRQIAIGLARGGLAADQRQCQHHERQNAQDRQVAGEIGRASCRERVCQYV